MYEKSIKKCIVDFRMRKVEKEYIRSLGYEVIDNKYNLKVYDEISSHADIYYLKILDKLVVSKCTAVRMAKELEGIKYEVGDAVVESEYPLDIPYNVCIIGEFAVHNFKYTDKKVAYLLGKYGYKKIDVEQGYTNCSVTVIDENSAITSDIEIAKALCKNVVDVLLASEPDITLLKRTNKNILDQNKMFFEKSDMQGFIGGAMARIDNKVILFGDYSKLVNGRKIKEFIEKKGLEFVDFKGLNVIDYGGIMIIENEGEIK